jgi:hypothetical protein
MDMKKWLAVIMLFFVANGASAQCAMCKAVAESNMNGGDSMASGLNNGIMYLMAFPYILIGSVAYLIYRHRKKLNKAKSA